MNNIKNSEFGVLESGQKINSYRLANSNGMAVTIINFGAAVVKIEVPDRLGKIEDVILGYENLNQYVNDTSYLGAIVGRFGNRINKGHFSLDGKEFQLSTNESENHLHGGINGFNKAVWVPRIVEHHNSYAVEFDYISPDGEEGYPGTATIKVTYVLTQENSLQINYTAASNKPTIINPTSHCYFNLTGSPQNTILNHELMINADKFTPIDNSLITTGELKNVQNTPMDFRISKKIGDHIDENDEQLSKGLGYDHNWVLNDYNGNVQKAASVYEPNSGRFMQVFTDQPGLQFYSGNYLNEKIKGKYGINYKPRTGFCLECQHFPDSPNKKNFPSTILRPGEIYKQTTIYNFSVKQ